MHGQQDPHLIGGLVISERRRSSYITRRPSVMLINCGMA